MEKELKKLPKGFRLVKDGKMKRGDIVRYPLSGLDWAKGAVGCDLKWWYSVGAKCYRKATK